MGSSCYGEPNLGSETSRKGRKSTTNSDKPKQPRRGLGVAQLEKIRLHNQMGYTNYLPPPSPQNPLSHNLTQEYMIRQTPYSSSSSFVDSPPSSSSYAFSGNPSFDQMGLELNYLERENIGYADVQPDINARWPHGNVFQDPHQFTQPIITRQLFEQEIEGSLERRRRKVSGSMGSTNHNSESNGNQDLDLELRLSL